MINTFPEAPQILDELIDSCLQDIKRVRGLCDSAIERNAVKGEHDLLASTLADYTDRLKRLRWQKKALTNDGNNGNIDSMMKARAKAVPIDGMIEFRRGKALCIWHDDTKPSLSLKGNRVKCFVCGEGGDAIDVYQKLHGVSWRQAVRKLGG